MAEVRSPGRAGRCSSGTEVRDTRRHRVARHRVASRAGVAWGRQQYDPAWAIGRSHPRRCDADQSVVGNERNGEMHGHEHEYRFSGLSSREDPQVREQEEQRDEDRKTEKEPSGGRRDQRDDRPSQGGTDHSDDGQLGVVREPEVRIALCGGKEVSPEGDEGHVDCQGSHDRDDRGGHERRRTGVSTFEREVDVESSQQAPGCRSPLLG